MGMEGAGIVEQVGDESQIGLVGKKVSFLSKGAWGEYVNASVETLIEFGEDADFKHICYA